MVTHPPHYVERSLLSQSHGKDGPHNRNTHSGMYLTPAGGGEGGEGEEEEGRGKGRERGRRRKRRKREDERGDERGRT